MLKIKLDKIAINSFPVIFFVKKYASNKVPSE